MLLKRKRSEDELSCFSSGGIGYSSPMRSDHGDVVMMDTDTCSPASPSANAVFSPSMQGRSRSCTPSHLPSRTSKRLRNGRPSDQEVYRKLSLTTWHEIFRPVIGSLTVGMTLQRTRSRCFIKRSSSSSPRRTTSCRHQARPAPSPPCHRHRRRHLQPRISPRCTPFGSCRPLNRNRRTLQRPARPSRWRLRPRSK